MDLWMLTLKLGCLVFEKRIQLLSDMRHQMMDHFKNYTISLIINE